MGLTPLTMVEDYALDSKSRTGRTPFDMAVVTILFATVQILKCRPKDNALRLGRMCRIDPQ